MVYGVVNLILSLVSIGGMVVLAVVCIHHLLEYYGHVTYLIYRMLVHMFRLFLIQSLSVYFSYLLMDLSISSFSSQVNQVFIAGALMLHLSQLHKMSMLLLWILITPSLLIFQALITTTVIIFGKTN